MHSFKIIGKIEPPWFEVTFDFQPQVSYRIDEADLDLKCTIAIKKSDIIVACESNRWDDGTIAWILPYLFDWVSAQIDLFTFASGKVFNVHLDRAEYPDGSSRQLMGTAPDLAQLATAYKMTGSDDKVRVEMRDVLHIVIGNPPLMMALRDLTSALRYGHNSLANCGRAIEALRRSLWGRDEKNKEDQKRAWKKLRDALHVSRSYLQTITDESLGPRHGSTVYVTSSVRQDVLKKSWTVMNRFLLYRLGGDQPLSESEYPML